MTISDLFNVLDDNIMCNVVVCVENPFKGEDIVSTVVCIKKCSELRGTIIDNVKVLHITAYKMLGGEPALQIAIKGVLE